MIDAELDAACEKVLDTYPFHANRAKWRPALIDLFVDKVLQATDAPVCPERVREILLRKLEIDP